MGVNVMKKEGARKAVARSTIYKSLSLAFSPQTPEVREFIRGKLAEKLEAAMPLLPDNYQLVGWALPTAISSRYLMVGGAHPTNLEKDASRLLDALANCSDMETEYNRLFRVGLVCTPYETEHDPMKSVRKGPVLSDILGFYTAFGLKPSEQAKELPDHIAVELEFMSWLVLKEAYARARGWKNKLELTLTAERKFLGDHLGSWVFPFCDNVEKNAAAPFYSALAGLLRNFIRHEIDFLGVDPIRFDASPEIRPDDNEELSCPFLPSS